MLTTWRNLAGCSMLVPQQPEIHDRKWFWLGGQLSMPICWQPSIVPTRRSLPARLNGACHWRQRYTSTNSWEVILSGRLHRGSRQGSRAAVGETRRSSSYIRTGRRCVGKTWLRPGSDRLSSAGELAVDHTACPKVMSWDSYVINVNGHRSEWQWTRRNSTRQRIWCISHISPEVKLST